MKLINQICSLELSKQLKKLGVKQDSLYVWGSNIAGAGILPKQEDFVLIGIDRKGEYPNIFNTTYSAFTVAELGELLPDAVATYRYETYDDDRDIWACIKYVEGNHEKYEYVVHTKTEANVRAKMLIYLLENKIRNLK